MFREHPQGNPPAGTATTATLYLDWSSNVLHDVMVACWLCLSQVMSTIRVNLQQFCSDRLVAPSPITPPQAALDPPRLQRPRHNRRKPLGGSASSDAARRQHRKPCGCRCVACCRTRRPDSALPRRLCHSHAASAAAPARRARPEAAAAGCAQHGTAVGHTQVWLCGFELQQRQSPCPNRYARHWERSMRMTWEAPHHHIVVAA